MRHTRGVCDSPGQHLCVLSPLPVSCCALLDRCPPRHVHGVRGARPQPAEADHPLQLPGHPPAQRAHHHTAGASLRLFATAKSGDARYWGRWSNVQLQQALLRRVVCCESNQCPLVSKASQVHDGLLVGDSSCPMRLVHFSPPMLPQNRFQELPCNTANCCNPGSRLLPHWRCNVPACAGCGVCTTVVCLAQLGSRASARTVAIGSIMLLRLTWPRIEGTA